MSKPDSFFKGQELPKLLVLLTILIVGMVAAWQFIYYKKNQAEAPAGPVAPPVPIVADKSVEFETVKDKTEIGLRDMAAYKLLLERAKKTPPAELAWQSHGEVVSLQLWERPEHYRGVPIRIVGTARRVLTWETKQCKSGRLYEAWVVTPDSQLNPYACVFEEIPKGFPLGDDVSQRIVFNGYFLKLMKYKAGAEESKRVPLGFYTSPVLIGRIGWTPPTAEGGGMSGGYKWIAIGLAIMFVISFFRWMTGLRKSLRTLSKTPSIRERPNDMIEPEEFAAWLDRVPHEHEADREIEEPAH